MASHIWRTFVPRIWCHVRGCKLFSSSRSIDKAVRTLEVEDWIHETASSYLSGTLLTAASHKGLSLLMQACGTPSRACQLLFNIKLSNELHKVHYTSQLSSTPHISGTSKTSGNTNKRTLVIVDNQVIFREVQYLLLLAAIWNTRNIVMILKAFWKLELKRWSFL